MIKKKLNSVLAFGAVSVALIASGCSGGSTANADVKQSSTGNTSLSGTVKIDGSSTVLPISTAVADEFGATHSKVNVEVSGSGTGGGFKKFIAGEIDICDASRPIEPEEVEKLKAANIEFVELPVAFDGLSIIVSPQNTWADSLTTAELQKLWAPDSKINNWKDLRPGFPDQPLKLHGPGTDSGTFEYFTEAIVKKKKSSRSDYSQSEDDNIIINGVAGDKGALGYLGYAYYVESKDKIKIVKVDDGKGPVEPTEATVTDGTYSPLSRPLFIYVSKKSLERPEVKEFVKFYLSAAARNAIKDTGYVLLPEEAYALALKHVDEMKTGTRFHGVQPGMKISDVMAQDGK